MSWFLLPSPTSSQRLDLTLIESMSQLSPPIKLSRNHAKRLIESSQVRLDGQLQARSSHQVAPAQTLELSMSALLELKQDPQHEAQPSALKASTDQALAQIVPQLELSAQDIIYEDEVIIALNKPSGLTSHQTLDPSRDHLIAALARYMMARDALHAPPYLALHHRLDVETSGVIVISKARSANRALMESFRQRHAKKQYLALVATSTTLKPRWNIEDHLSWEAGEQRMLSVLSGGDWAKTRFETRAQREGVALVLASPETGRRHQLRAHLSGVNAPILGDERYYGPDQLGGVSIKRVMLHAYTLTLPHPSTAQPLTLCAPIPEDMRALMARFELNINV